MLRFSRIHLPSRLILHYLSTLLMLNTSQFRLTFFAAPDAALRRKRGHHHPHKQLSEMSSSPLTILEQIDLADALDLIDSADHPSDPEERKKIIKFILHVILSYHVIDGEYDIEKLGAHNTVPSHLKFHHVFDNQPIRLRVENTLMPPATWVNFFSRSFLTVSATNGEAYTI